jgi:dihydroxyacetone kinase-like predicted kinase
MEAVCEAIRHGSLMGARGNSGVILSQILRGLADTFAPLETVSAADVAKGLRHAADGTQAVLRPVEGTISPWQLRGRVGGAGGGRGRVDLTGLFERATDAARDAVARTPDLLPVLREAGVVDAGGRGFELLLAAVATSSTALLPALLVVSTEAVEMHLHHRHDEMEGGRYEVMFLAAADAHVPALTDAWDVLGDSIVVVGGDGL